MGQFLLKFIIFEKYKLFKFQAGFISGRYEPI